MFIKGLCNTYVIRTMAVRMFCDVSTPHISPILHLP